MAKTQSTWPTSIDTTLQTDRASGDTITSDSYDIIEDAIFELETKVGVDGSAVATSLDYKTAWIKGTVGASATTLSGTTIVTPTVSAENVKTTTVTANILSGTLNGYFGSGVELVSNGGMESGNPPTGWAALNTPEVFEQSGVQKHGGSYSAHVNDSTPSYGGFQNQGFAIPTTAGHQYKLSFWYYITSGSFGTALYDGTWVLMGGPPTLTTIGSWQYMEVILTAINTGAGGNGQMIFTNSSNSVAAEFYIDDVSVQEVVNYNDFILVDGTRALTAALTGTNFWGSTAISAVTISGTTVVTPTVSATNVKATTVTATDLSSTNIKATTVTGTTFSGTDVKATTITGTTLSGTTLSGTNISATTITATTFSGIDVKATTITGITLSGTTFSGTNVSAATITATTVTAATFSGTDIKATTITGTDLSGTNLSGTNVKATTITATTFSGTDVKATTITGTTLSGTDLSGTNVKATTITATTFSGTDVKATTVSGTTVWGSTGVSGVTISATNYQNVPAAAGTDYHSFIIMGA